MQSFALLGEVRLRREQALLEKEIVHDAKVVQHPLRQDLDRKSVVEGKCV